MRSAALESVAVVGGGVIGMAVALELSTSFDVTLLDPQPGRGASWAAAGMLSPAAEIAPGEEPLVAALRDAVALWPSFAAHLEAACGFSIGFERCASLLMGASPSDAREATRLAGLITQAGLAAVPVHAEELQSLEPSLAASLHSGWLLTGDCRVDNRLLVQGLLEALKAGGVRIIEDECTRIGLARRVQLTLAHRGAVEADRAVLATGVSMQIDGTESLGLPPVRPVRGATLRLGNVGDIEIPTRTIRAIVDSTYCYVVPREDGSVVLGATSEEQGYEEVTPVGGIFRLLEAARTVFPGLDELVLDEAAVGLRPATEDHLPFVSRLNDPRVVGALGHYRNGILLCPLAARQVAALLTERS